MRQIALSKTRSKRHICIHCDGSFLQESWCTHKSDILYQLWIIKLKWKCLIFYSKIFQRAAGKSMSPSVWRAGSTKSGALPSLIRGPCWKVAETCNTNGWRGSQFLLRRKPQKTWSVLYVPPTSSLRINSDTSGASSKVRPLTIRVFQRSFAR